MPASRTTPQDQPPDPGAPTVLINTIPKSGTHFAGILLELVSVPPTGIHLGVGQYWNWNLAPSLDQIIRTPDAFKRPASLSECIALITPGHTFAHLDHTPQAVASLQARPEVRHLFLIRNLRGCLASAMRFVRKREALNSTADQVSTETPAASFLRFMDRRGPALMQTAKSQIAWASTPDVATFRFEDLVPDTDPQHRVQECARLLGFCGITPPDLPGLLARAAHTQTRTSSGKLTNWHEVWSDEAEARFLHHGGPALNAALNYPET